MSRRRRERDAPEGRRSSSFFYDLGRRLGPRARRGRALWTRLTGSDEEILEAEAAIGRDLAAALEAELPVRAEPADAEFLDAIGRQLQERLTNTRRRFRYVVLDVPERNAFALPGGHVYVSRPLLDLCDRDRDELAFVLGHEMAHVIRAHATDRTMSRLAVDFATRLSPARGQLARWIGGLGVRFFESAYSREQEFDADRFAVRLMRAAGFDATAAGRLLRRLDTGGRDDENGLDAWFASHPPVRERIREMVAES